MSDLSKKNSKVLRLSPGLLSGGKLYNISLLVLSEQEEGIVGEAFTLLRVGQYGPVARVAASKIMFGTRNPVVLDATLSEDRDNSQGDMKVKPNQK